MTEQRLVGRASVYVCLLHFANMRQKKDRLPGDVCK